MQHDFLGSGAPRIPKSFNGSPCTNQNYIMDYHQRNPSSWSPCSREDIKKYYRSSGGYGGNCMQALKNGGSGPVDPTTPRTPTTTIDPVNADCQDKNNNCKRLANRGFCKGRWWWAKWTRANCKKSCSLC